MNNCLEEQETTISYSRTENSVNIWTSDRTQITKFDKLCTRSDKYILLNEQRTKSGELIAKEYCIKDKSLITFRCEKRTLTDEQREKAAARLRSIKNNQNSAVRIGK